MRSGRSSSAAASAWKTLIDSVSPTTTLPSGAPISRPMRSPRARGLPIQPQVFQARISSRPHSARIVRVTASTAARGSGPRELPSR